MQVYLSDDTDCAARIAGNRFGDHLCRPARTITGFPEISILTQNSVGDYCSARGLAPRADRNAPIVSPRGPMTLQMMPQGQSVYITSLSATDVASNSRTSRQGFYSVCCLKGWIRGDSQPSSPLPVLGDRFRALYPSRLEGTLSFCSVLQSGGQPTASWIGCSTAVPRQLLSEFRHFTCRLSSRQLLLRASSRPPASDRAPVGFVRQTTAAVRPCEKGSEKNLSQTDRAE